MSLKSLVVMVGFVVVPFVVVPQHAAAQTVPVAKSGEPTFAPAHRARHRILITPRPLLYRRCVDWYELQDRPSGTVLYPQMRCWWVR
jgi:hypothetical protein